MEIYISKVEATVFLIFPFQNGCIMSGKVSCFSFRECCVVFPAWFELRIQREAPQILERRWRDLGSREPAGDQTWFMELQSQNIPILGLTAPGPRFYLSRLCFGFCNSVYSRSTVVSKLTIILYFIWEMHKYKLPEPPSTENLHCNLMVDNCKPNCLDNGYDPIDNELRGIERGGGFFPISWKISG